jgi:hypothetical protein
VARDGDLLSGAHGIEQGGEVGLGLKGADNAPESVPTTC